MSKLHNDATAVKLSMSKFNKVWRETETGKITLPSFHFLYSWYISKHHKRVRLWAQVYSGVQGQAGLLSETLSKAPPPPQAFSD